MIHPIPLLAWTISMTLAALLVEHPLLLLAVWGATLPVVHALRAWKVWVSYARVAVSTALLLAVLNPLFSPTGESVLWRADFVLPALGRPVVTLEALAFATMLALRLAAVLSAFAVLASKLDHDALLGILSARMRPAVVMPFGLAARFAPVVTADAACVADAQRARGLELDRGGWLRRTRHRGVLVMPLLERSLERAWSLAEAMEARGFASGPRTRFRPLPFGPSDKARTAAGLLPGAVALVLVLLALAPFRFYPALAGEAVPLLPFAAMLGAASAFPVAVWRLAE